MEIRYSIEHHQFCEIFEGKENTFSYFFYSVRGKILNPFLLSRDKKNRETPSIGNFYRFNETIKRM